MHSSPVVERADNSIHWMTQYVLVTLFQWIVIYLLDTTIWTLKWYYDQKVTLPFLFIFRKYALWVPPKPNFKPWLWQEVRLFELWIVNTIAYHYSIQKWPSSKERVGSKEVVASSNQTTQLLDGTIFSKASVDRKQTMKN